jgi:hypothetical protein
MSRNRKNQTAALRLVPALKALALCLFLGGSGVGYVWQKEQINLLGQRFKQCELRYEQTVRQNEKKAGVLARLQSPQELEARIKQLDLGMVAAQPDQVVRILEPSWLAGGERLYAVQRAQAPSR